MPAGSSTSSPTSTALAATMPRDLAEELGRRAIVDGHDDHAAQHRAPERDDPLGPVFTPDDDFVVGPIPCASSTRANRSSCLRDGGV